jgi:hypothetical protein
MGTYAVLTPAEAVESAQLAPSASCRSRLALTARDVERPRDAGVCARGIRQTPAPFDLTLG